MKTKYKNKKAFTLSVNFLVIMIIMVVLFGFGIYLFTTIFNNAIKLDEQVHQQETDRLNMLMDSGDIVTVLNPQQTAEKDALRFPIGISNENSDISSNQFIIEIEEFEEFNNCNYKFVKNDGSSFECLNDVVLIPSDFEGNGFQINNNERKFRLMQINPKHYSGFYTIKFRVKRQKNNEWLDYGKLQMIWVTVP
jgi:hypothetical protein